MANGSITLWGAGELLADFFGRSTEWPANFYMALVRTTAPGPFTEGGELDEPDEETGYIRVEIPNAPDTWLIDDEVLSNVNDIIFPQTIGSWGTIKYWALCNDTTEGQLYFYGSFIDALTSEVDDQFVISAGTLSIEVGPIFAGADDGS